MGKIFTTLRTESPILESFEKAKKAEIGEIHTWNGVKMQKMPDGWKPVALHGNTDFRVDIAEFQKLTPKEQIKFYDDYAQKTLTILHKLNQAKKNKDAAKIAHYKSKYGYMYAKLEALKPFYDKVKQSAGNATTVSSNMYADVRVGDVVEMSKIKDIFNQYNKKPELKELGEKVFKIAEEINIPVRIRDIRGNAVGLYHWSGAIEYDTKIFDKSKVSERQLINTLLHEAIHSCTCHYLDHERYLDPRTPLPIKEACEELIDIYKATKKQLKGNYGTTDVMEFVAELSNPTFRKRLQAAELWQRVVNALAKLFYGKEVKGTVKVDGLEKATNALNAILDNVDTDFLVRRSAKFYEREELRGKTHFYPKPQK